MYFPAYIKHSVTTTILPFFSWGDSRQVP